jgi:hypothetical protein
VSAFEQSVIKSCPALIIVHGELDAKFSLQNSTDSKLIKHHFLSYGLRKKLWKVNLLVDIPFNQSSLNVQMAVVRSVVKRIATILIDLVDVDFSFV